MKIQLFKYWRCSEYEKDKLKMLCFFFFQKCHYDFIKANFGSKRDASVSANIIF